MSTTEFHRVDASGAITGTAVVTEELLRGDVGGPGSAVLESEAP
ncbi:MULTISPECIES: hypothetical protein [unclassified Nocardiopsis]